MHRALYVSIGSLKSESISHSIMPKFFAIHGFSVHGSLGKNTGVGSHFLLQGIFPTQGSNPCPTLEGRFFTTEPPGKGEVGRANSNFVWEYGKGIQQADGIIMVFEQEYFSLCG